MKHIFVVGLIVGAFTFGVIGADAAKSLLVADMIAEVGLSKDKVSVYKVVDGTTVCYITRGGKTVYHAIDCVK